MGDLALSLSTKLAMLPVANGRLTESLTSLGKHLNDEPEVVACIREGAGYRVRDERVLWEVLVSLDCFLFETYSTFQILDSFIVRFSRSILGQNIKGGKEGEAIKVLAQKTGNVGWLDELRESRHLFSHEAAPWIALEVTKRNPFDFELLVLKRAGEDSSDPSIHLHMDQCREIWSGLKSALRILHAWVNEQIEGVERSEAAAGTPPRPATS